MLLLRRHVSGAVTNLIDGFIELINKESIRYISMLENISDASSEININIRVETIHSTSRQWYGNIKASLCTFLLTKFFITAENTTKPFLYFLVLYFVFGIEIKSTRRYNFLRKNFNHSEYNSISHCIPDICFKLFAVLAVLQYFFRVYLILLQKIEWEIMSVKLKKINKLV